MEAQQNREADMFSRFRPSTNPGMHRRALRPFDFHSAGGGVYVAEERLKAASYINFWP
jgi:hypothetical protein